jgi:hypothetical protein
LAIHHPDKPRIGKGAFSIYAGEPNEAPEDEEAEDPKIGNKQRFGRLDVNRG